MYPPNGGTLQPGQALLPPVQLGRQIGVLATRADLLVHGRIGGRGIGQQRRRGSFQLGDLGLDLLLLADQPAAR